MNNTSSLHRLARRAYQKFKSFRLSDQSIQCLDREIEERISCDIDYFDSIKGKYAGRRGFVIGNGPSLKVSDLDRLQGEICISSNKIYLAFDQTFWRPSFYTIADPLLWEKIKCTIGSKVPTVHIPHYLSNHQTCSANIKTFRHIGNAADLSEQTSEILFSDNFKNGAYGGYTVTYENIQLAFHLGLNPIYIIGCDHYYKGEGAVVANQTIPAPATSNHFVKNYRDVGEIVNVAPIEHMNKSYLMAHKFAIARGITLMNATRGGYLEIFPRADFDEITVAPKTIS